MSWLSDLLYGVGRFLRGLIDPAPKRPRVPTSRELDEADRDARDELRERMRDKK